MAKQTDIFRKSTSKLRALLPSSAHPGHITTNIVYSMEFRLLRICSTEEYFEKRLIELKSDFLLPRNYHPKVVDSQFKRVKNLPGENYCEKRKLALVKKEKVKTKKIELLHPWISTLCFQKSVMSLLNITKECYSRNQS